MTGEPARGSGLQFAFWVASGLVAAFAAVVDVILFLAWAHHRGGDLEFDWSVPAVVTAILIASGGWFAARWKRELLPLRRSDVVDDE